MMVPARRFSTNGKLPKTTSCNPETECPPVAHAPPAVSNLRYSIVSSSVPHVRLKRLRPLLSSDVLPRCSVSAPFCARSLIPSHITRLLPRNCWHLLSEAQNL